MQVKVSFAALLHVANSCEHHEQDRLSKSLLHTKSFETEDQLCNIVNGTPGIQWPNTQNPCICQLAHHKVPGPFCTDPSLYSQLAPETMACLNYVI